MSVSQYDKRIDVSALYLLPGVKALYLLGIHFMWMKTTGKKVFCKPDPNQKGAIQIERTKSKGFEESNAYGLKLSPLALVQTMDSICLNLKVSRPLPAKTYRLYLSDKGWQQVGEKKTQKDVPLQFNHIPTGAIYRLLPEDQKNTERLFTYSANQQVWW